MLQCGMTGKAQKAYSNLRWADQDFYQNYDKVKSAVLKAYELVQMAYIHIML